MATSRREPDARNNRTIRAMSTGIKPTDPAKGLRRARSVPSSPDRKLSPSHDASSSNAYRPSSSFSTRTGTSRSTFGSASSSIHSSKAPQTSSSTTTAKPANTTKGKADKSGGSSVWPPALTARNRSSKDMNRTAKSSSAMQKSNLSSRPGVDKMAASSAKQRTQKATPGALAGGKTQAVPSVRAPGTTTKKTMGVANSVPSIQRTSIQSRPIEAPKVNEQEVELLMEFDEMESISTPSIEEHLQERLPDPVELKQVDVIAYLLFGDNPSEPASNQQEDKNEEVVELISEEKHQVPDNNSFNGRDNADIGINSKVQAVKEAIDNSELKEAANETELKEAVDETELNEVVSESELYKDVNTTKYTEDALEPMLIEKEEAEENVEMVVPPKKTLKPVQGWSKDDGKSNEMKEEGRSKPTEERKSKVMALIGRFETAMSG